MTKNEIEERLQQLIKEYGEWSYDIPLPHNVWTRGNLGVPHTRLKRLLQVAADLSVKPLGSCRVLDLGCLDGQFSIEFALQGAQEVVGVEAREANIKKAIFAKEALQLDNVEFVQDDVRNVSREKYGTFDIIICSGLLYHLDSPDVFVFMEKLYEVCNRLLIVDTHISLTPKKTVSYKNKTYSGHYYREYPDSEMETANVKKLWAAYGNPLSFWFSRPSLVNFFAEVGFTSVHECFNPPHLNFGQPGLEHENRCTFVAVRGEKIEVRTSPAANAISEQHAEGTLAYCEPSTLSRALNSRVLPLVEKGTRAFKKKKT